MAASRARNGRRGGVLRQADRATLATALAAGPETWPYASLVLVALDLDAAPLLLLSDLAEHTREPEARPARLAPVRCHGGTRRSAGRRPCHGAGRDRPGRGRAAARPLCRPPPRQRRPIAVSTISGSIASPRARAHLVGGIRPHPLDRGDRPAAGGGSSGGTGRGRARHPRPHESGPWRSRRPLCATASRPAGEGWRLTGVDPDGADLRRETSSRGSNSRLPSSCR